MTTFDPQPQSRRAVRQSERAEGRADEQPSYPGFANPDGFGDNGDMWDTVARRAAQLHTNSRPEQGAGGGRRAANPPAPAAEPLTYATQNRAPMPGYESPFRSQPEPDLQATQALPRQDAPQYRVRDYSPEGRRAATPPATPAPAAAAPVPTWSVGEQLPAPVETPAAAVPEPQAQPKPVEHTMTRRELRAMLAAQQGAVADAAAAAPVAEAQSQQVSAQQVAAEPAVAPPALVQPLPQPVVPGYDAPTETAAYPFVAPPAPVEQRSDEPSRSPFDALFSPPTAEPAAVDPAAAPTGVWTPPTGHWAAQLEADDDLPMENTLSRSIRSGQTATNALVLPSMPQHDDIRGPLTSTGEVMLTGSIDLPRSLGSTGTHDRIEHDGIDALFDANDTEINATDSSPVSAIRAVSTHTGGHSVTHTQKPKGNKVMTGLIIGASGMAVVVVGLLVSAFAFNVFG